ncbi:MAG: ABC transporter ATP-binding protein [Proteobacteria bacterium]|nr:ABC transporter ATP-binding protein [Pseudomonadota bacterium]
MKNPRTAVAHAVDQLKIGNARKKQKAAELSGGWKQRLALACATIHNPKLLLLDEPTAGVDPKARREFWDEIHRLSAEGVTTLVSTHYMDEAERCHKLAYIAYGKVLVKGTLKEIIQQSELNTFEITGPRLQSLKSKLEGISQIEQVSLFGQTLHVSSKKIIALDDILVQTLASDYQYHQITPTLEDIFIHLMLNNKDNFS